MKKDKTDDEIISQAHLNASGWGLDNFAKGTPFDHHFFYVLDFKYGKTQLIAIEPEGLSQSPQFEIGELVGAATHLMKKASKKKLSLTQLNQLGGILCGYFKQTAIARSNTVGVLQ